MPLQFVKQPATSSWYDLNDKITPNENVWPLNFLNSKLPYRKHIHYAFKVFQEEIFKKKKKKKVHYWKSSYMLCSCVHIKTIPWKFCFLNPKNSRVIYPWNFVNFLKSRLIFILFYCFWMFVNKLFTYLKT